MSCCDYNQCTGAHGCPVRSTPVTPTFKQCAKANICLSETSECHCDAKAIKEYSRMTLCVQVLLWIVVVSFAVMACYRHPELLRSFF